MPLPTIVIIVFVCSILFIDRVLFTKEARKAWYATGAVYAVGIFLIVEKDLLTSFSHLIGISRPIDVLIYFALIVLIRDFFIIRVRLHSLQKQITKLTRELTLKNK